MATTSPPHHVPSHMDPRIRARRIEVQRGAGRRRLQHLVDLGLVVAVAVGFAGALYTPLLDVDRLTVAGTRHTPADLVRERAGIQPGDQLIDVDLGAAGARVAELPWVEEVRLTRRLDGEVSVAVVERIPVAVAGSGAGAVLVDRGGRVLARAADEPALAASLPGVAGATAGLVPGDQLSGDAAGMLTVAARLVGVDPGIALAQSPDDGTVTATLSAGIVVRFGAPTGLDAKVRDLLTVLDQVDLTCAAVIDVRAPASPVLTRTEGCS